MRTVASRMGALGALTLTTLLVLAPVASAAPDKGPGAGGPSLGAAKTLLYFVVAPLAIIALVVLLVYAPSMFRGARYRPGRAWNYGPAWFGGPAEADDKLPAVRPTGGKGGASGSW